MTAAATEPAVSIFFDVVVDLGQPLKLGAFTSCEGLGVEVVLEQREEGGNNGFVWQLPTRMKFSNVKLSRPLCKDTGEVTDWLSRMTTKVSPTTANISAMTADGTTKVASWQLLGVVPVRWSGPSLNVESPKVAMETLELAHHGFAPRTTGSP